VILVYIFQDSDVLLPLGRGHCVSCCFVYTLLSVCLFGGCCKAINSFFTNSADDCERLSYELTNYYVSSGSVIIIQRTEDVFWPVYLDIQGCPKNKPPL